MQSQECCRGFLYLETKWQHYFTFGKNLGKFNYTPRQTPAGSLSMSVFYWFYSCCCDMFSPSSAFITPPLFFFNFLFCVPTLFSHFYSHLGGAPLSPHLSGLLIVFPTIVSLHKIYSHTYTHLEF